MKLAKAHKKETTTTSSSSSSNSNTSAEKKDEGDSKLYKTGDVDVLGVSVTDPDKACEG